MSVLFRINEEIKDQDNNDGFYLPLDFQDELDEKLYALCKEINTSNC